jgi:hypothetical protein
LSLTPDGQKMTLKLLKLLSRRQKCTPPRDPRDEAGLGVALIREWRRNPLESLKTDSEMAGRR